MKRYKPSFFLIFLLVTAFLPIPAFRDFVSSVQSGAPDLTALFFTILLGSFFPMAVSRG